ncbi:putative MOB kinase activator family protein [Tanacetum coccineum]
MNYNVHQQPPNMPNSHYIEHLLQKTPTLWTPCPLELTHDRVSEIQDLKLKEMDKNGGSNQLSAPMRRTGGDLLKKGKVRSELSYSTSNTLNFPKKFYDQCGGINLASAPRKLRSAMKKRRQESERNEIGGYDMQSEECKKRLKAEVEKHEDSTESVITKEEEEAAEALFELAQTFTDTDLKVTAKAEPSLMPGESMHPEPSIKAECADDSNVKKSRKICPVHIYICRFIKDMQTIENKELGIEEESKQVARVDAIPQKVMEYADKMSYNVENTHKWLFQAPQQQHATSTLHLTNPQNHYSVGFDGNLSTATTQQDVFSTQQQYYSDQFTPTACNQYWQNQRRETMAAPSGSSIKLFGSQYAQRPLLHALGPKLTLNTEQQQCISMSLMATNKGKMPFSDHPHGYNDKGSLFFVDSGPTLKLSL